jgi:hypothetical protein
VTVTIFLIDINLIHSETRAAFHWLMAFGQLDFQPASANVFMMDVALHWFIYGRKPISGMLKNHQVIGSHTDIFFFYRSGGVSRLTWSHPGIRPFGVPLALQCQCKSYKSWTPSVTLTATRDDVASIRLVCKYCKHTAIYFKPNNIRRVAKGVADRSEVGDWYIEDM